MTLSKDLSHTMDQWVMFIKPAPETNAWVVSSILTGSHIIVNPNHS